MGPVSLNALKHHAGFISSFVRLTPLPELRQSLRAIGHSQIDLYTGILTSDTVASEVIHYLKRGRNFGYSSYCKWIWEGGGFRRITLSDGSLWILRIGNDKNRYAHVHPARGSQFTLRVSANTLKTAIVLAAWMHHRQANMPGLSIINEVRHSFAELPPLKTLRATAAFNRILPLLG